MKITCDLLNCPLDCCVAIILWGNLYSHSLLRLCNTVPGKLYFFFWYSDFAPVMKGMMQRIHEANLRHSIHIKIA